MPDKKAFRAERVQIDFGGGDVLTVAYRRLGITLALARAVVNGAAEAQAEVDEAKVEAASKAVEDSPSISAEAGGEDVAVANARAVEGYGSTVRDALLKMLVSWDLTDGGQIVPITAEALDEVDVELLTAIFMAITEAQKPTPTTPAPSATDS